MDSCPLCILATGLGLCQKKGLSVCQLCLPGTITTFLAHYFSQHDLFEMGSVVYLQDLELLELLWPQLQLYFSVINMSPNLGPGAGTGTLLLLKVMYPWRQIQ